MTERKAKKQLSRLLESYTPGTMLHLLGEIFRDAKEEARKAGDELLHERCRNVEITLLVVGMGIDAACPR